MRPVPYPDQGDRLKQLDPKPTMDNSAHIARGVRLLVEGREVPWEGISVNDGLNFGRRWEDVQTRTYELTVPLADLGWLAGEFAVCAAEMRQDDAGDDDPSPFAALDHEADLRVAARNPTVFAEVVEWFFGRRILEYYLWTDLTSAELVINGLEDVEVVGSSLRLRGWGWAPRQRS